MKKIIIIALSLVFLATLPGAWAGMGGGMGGGGHMGGGMMGGGNQWGDRPSSSMDRYEREDRARRQFEEDTRVLRRSIDQKQDALDRELDRSDPDMNRVKQLNRDLSRLRDEMGMEQRRYQQFRQEEAGRYGNRAYPRNW
ncbi:MAG TPA: hypothetical protein VLT88_06840 [Desulfosarcina sp.]|nr:hypothetical protein [Desulfosarcina sp.]